MGDLMGKPTWSKEIFKKNGEYSYKHIILCRIHIRRYENYICGAPTHEYGGPFKWGDGPGNGCPSQGNADRSTQGFRSFVDSESINIAFF